jgi:hypothetical protein
MYVPTMIVGSCFNVIGNSSYTLSKHSIAGVEISQLSIQRGYVELISSGSALGMPAISLVCMRMRHVCT